MKTFSLEQHLKAVYGQAPKESKRPVIGITTNHSGIDVTVRELYHNQIVKVGGTPLLIPPIDDADVIQSTLERVDAIILTGGADVNPLWAGEQPSTKLHHINAVRDLPELMITRLAFNRQIPILGICRGVQVLAMALEGRIHQDISHIATNFQHSQDADQSEPTHSVDIEKDSMLHEIFGTDNIFVNSFHHQAVAAAGPHLRVVATSPDGIIEAVESSEHKAVMGVQWHPEWLGDDGQPLFKWQASTVRHVASRNATSHSTRIATRRCSSPKE